MAELEKKEVETDVDEVDTDTDDVEVETEETDEETEEQEDEWYEEISYDQALKWKSDAKKASSKIAELKRQIKKAPKSSNDVRAILAEEKFYDKNSDAEPYRKQIEKFVKAWISREDAFDIASKKDKQVQKTREVYWKSMVWKKSWSEMSVLTIEAFDKMTPTGQSEYMEKMNSKYGKVKFK